MEIRKITLAAILCGVLAAGALIGANTFSAPQTVLHVVTVQWKADSTPQQQQAAIDGLRKMAAEVPGVKSIWLKKIKTQPPEFGAVFAIEFESRAAFEAYANSPAHKAWEKLYLPIREESNTQDISN